MANFTKKSNRNLHFKFQNEKFQIYKMKISIFPFQIFVTYFNPNLKSIFFQFFHFLWPIFFKNLKQKIFNSNYKNNFFSKFFISNFPYDVNDFFLSPRLSNLVKDYKNYLLPLPKIVIYCIPPLGDMVHRKRALIN
jgi:hypothetical protein